MSILIYFLLGAFTFFTILLVIGMFMPQQVHLEKTITIQREPDAVFAEVADFENFVQWSPWSAKDPNMTSKFEGEKISVGSKYSWQGNKNVGTGSMEITHIEANERVEMDLNFGPRGNAKCGFILVPVDHSTKVTWYFDSDMGRNPLARLMGLFMEKFIGNDYTEGLNNLAKKLEQQ
jgi:hypothetical protein